MTSPGFLQEISSKMTIKQRIIIAVVLQAIMICIIGLFVYFSFENVLSKLRSIEIIDDVNIALLEMRKAEKNYFLYKDLNALKELAKLGEEKHETIVVLQILGGADLAGGRGGKVMIACWRLSKNTWPWRITSSAPRRRPRILKETSGALGQELTSLSEQLLKQERENVSHTINNNVLMLIASLGIIFIIQLVLWQYFLQSDYSRIEHHGTHD